MKLGKVTRIGISTFVGYVSGNIGFVLAATFGPLLYPATITGSSRGEDIVVFSVPVFFLLFGIFGFWVCWKVTRRFARQSSESIRTFTKFPE
jgi:hypothetical protein